MRFSYIIIYYFYIFQELNLFQDSLQSLKIAQVKFQNSGESLEKISPDSKGKSILVPLTGSVSFKIFIIGYDWYVILSCVDLS